MTQELEEKLFKKYSKIFADKDKPMTETCMCWGIECGDGWYWLIDQLCSQLQWMTDNPPYTKEGRMEVPQIIASQVKEKFGGLRFYVNSANAKQNAIIGFAESLSDSICEHCGSTKDVGQTKGWITTLCKECATKHNKLDNWKQYEKDI